MLGSTESPAKIPSVQARRSADWCSGHSNKDNVELNVVLLGAPKVGKSSLVSQFLWRIFKSNYKCTVEDFNWIEYEFEGTKTFWLKLIDTSGSCDFPAMRDYNIKHADAFLLVFAVDDNDSFERTKEFMKLIEEMNKKRPPVILVANKVDLVKLNDCQAVLQKAEQFAIDIKCTLMKATAKNYDSVELLFHQLITISPFARSMEHMKKRRQSMPADSEIAAEFVCLSQNAAGTERERRWKNSCIIS